MRRYKPVFCKSPRVLKREGRRIPGRRRVDRVRRHEYTLNTPRSFALFNEPSQNSQFRGSHGNHPCALGTQSRLADPQGHRGRRGAQGRGRGEHRGLAGRNRHQEDAAQAALRPGGTFEPDRFGESPCGPGLGRPPGRGGLVSIPKRGDYVHLDLDPAAGREQQGPRFALVLSGEAFNAKTGLAFMAPITTKVKGWPFEVAIPAGQRCSGVVLADHVRSLDWRARGVKVKGAAPVELVEEVAARLAAIVEA
ncbi:MAG: type II toxin-antitoxin system PemK/MazF family toxin [Desulfovibrionaceae bacterium]|nr:type II toxin-antitoxin system PemK/MazF family toxin [Desulfovibrionaceae bacterium]MBF0514932.1 type II toxin-antitoxin system PemK/MazF family toxin [Desulfovibrionaceae bacterium]